MATIWLPWQPMPLGFKSKWSLTFLPSLVEKAFSMTIILQFHGNQTIAMATPMNFGPPATRSTYVPNLKFQLPTVFRKNVTDISVLYIVILNSLGNESTECAETGLAEILRCQSECAETGLAEILRCQYYPGGNHYILSRATSHAAP